MFYVYGLSGPIFQGTLENLGRMPPIMRRSPVVAARRIGDQIENMPVAPQPQAAEPSPLGEQAIAAYKSMLPDSLERGPLYHANQIMQRMVITINADDEVAYAWRKLVDQGIHQAPVLDANLQLVGMISERNLLTVLNVEAGAVRDVMAKTVADVMTTPVVAASPVTDIRRIARAMLDHHADGVPILDETRSLVGFISRTDILKAVIADPPLSIWR